ncbi:MAG TPA: kelch repeat-containing protein [Gemmatimonadales bacterium]|nr:kelch repeat-containing protein [Gemmatimonadales bacterium]
MMRIHVRHAGAAAFLVAGSAACSRAPAPPPPPQVATRAAPPGGTWHTEPPMRYARAAHAVVSTGEAIYALAGTGAGGAPVLAIERFDGRTWSVESTLPGPGLNAPAAAVLGRRIYVIGGFNTTTNVPSDRVYVYDTQGRTWSEAAPLPAPRGGHAAVAWDGRIHVIGGGNSRSTIADHDVYDPAQDRWTALAPLPRAEGSPAAAVSEGKLYAIGGRSGPGDFGAVDIYDPAADRWSAGPEIEPRGTAGAVVYCGAMYLFGGESQARATTLADVLRLGPGESAWQRLPDMPTARDFARAVVFRDAVYVVGGSPTPGRSHASEGSAVVERFQCV